MWIGTTSRTPDMASRCQPSCNLKRAKLVTTADCHTSPTAPAREIAKDIKSHSQAQWEKHIEALSPRQHSLEKFFSLTQAFSFHSYEGGSRQYRDSPPIERRSYLKITTFQIPGKLPCYPHPKTGQKSELAQNYRQSHYFFLFEQSIRICAYATLLNPNTALLLIYYPQRCGFRPQVLDGSSTSQFINDCITYAQAIAILDSLFIKKRNVIFARHCFLTRNQQTEETVSEYLQILNQLSKDCDFTDVKAEEYRKEYIRDAFIRGLKCPSIRLRLLENTSMTLDQAFEQARTLESAEVHAASYMGSSFPVQSAAMETEDFSEETVATSAASSSSSRSQKCFICGNDLHSRTLCPARDVTCRNSGKKGHYQRVCKSRPGRNSSNVVASSNTLVAISGSTHCLQKSIIKALVNNIQLSALIDTGSSLSFLNEKHAAKCKLKVEPYLGKYPWQTPLW
ncbi:putative retrovirus-related pol polyprotein from transposon opus [Trichonephila clavipes]|nr:putative retrovirus-related pol polyprotein from transposon opus [Trichonephila clavipes]